MEGLGRRARQDKLDGPVGRGNLSVGLDVQLALHVDGVGGDGEAGALGDCQFALDVEAGGARQVEVAGGVGVDDVAGAARDNEGLAGAGGRGGEEGGEVLAGRGVGQAGVAAQRLEVAPDGRHEAAGRVGRRARVIGGVIIDQEAAGAHLVVPLEAAHLVRLHRGRKGTRRGVHGLVDVGHDRRRRRQQGGILHRGGQDGLEGGRRPEEDGQGQGGSGQVHGCSVGIRLVSSRLLGRATCSRGLFDDWSHTKPTFTLWRARCP